MFVPLASVLTRLDICSSANSELQRYTTHCPLSVREQFVRRTPKAAITIPLPTVCRVKNSTMRKVAILFASSAGVGGGGLRFQERRAPHDRLRRAAN